MYLAKLSSFPEIQENVVSIITGSIQKLIKLEFFIEWKAPFELKTSALSSPHWLVHCQHVLFQSGFEDSLENPRRSYILGRWNPGEHGKTVNIWDDYTDNFIKALNYCIALNSKHLAIYNIIRERKEIFHCSWHKKRYRWYKQLEYYNEDNELSKCSDGNTQQHWRHSLK